MKQPCPIAIKTAQIKNRKLTSWAVCVLFLAALPNGAKKGVEAPMTSTATPSSNSELRIPFGAENHFASESRLKPYPFNQTAHLAMDETPMKRGLEAEKCCSSPRFYPSTTGNRSNVSLLGFRLFPICVYSVFHPWPIELHSSDPIPECFYPTGRFAPTRLAPFASNPRCLETLTRSTIQPFNDSRSTRQSSNIAGYLRLFEAI
jgi:hypothetical protein